MTKMIVDRPMFLSETIKKMEEHYNAKYVFTSCIKGKYGWIDSPAAIFYTEVAHPEGSNYFGLLWKGNNLVICNGVTATEPFQGIKVGEEIIFSRYGHDYYEHNGMFVDGGRDYMRYGGNIDFDKVKFVTLKVEKDKLVIYGGGND